MNRKGLFQSKTVWLALIQAVAGVLVVVLTELDMVGYVGIVKSIVDVILRTMTDKPLRM